MDEGGNERSHDATATIRHAPRFSALEVPNRREPPSRQMIEKWVLPFYQVPLWSEGERFVKLVRPVLGEIDEALAGELLSYMNWRPKTVGAYFVAVKRLAGLEQLIGRLLLRSDVCYAGAAYCVALARLGAPTSVELLREYLDYYLARPDLYFDQASAMAALGHLDRRRGTALRDGFMDRWSAFIADKPHWSLEQADRIFDLTMQAIEKAAAV